MPNYHASLREPRLGVMLHYDASRSDAGAVQWLLHDPACHVSYNWLVTDDGTVHEIAPASARAWHAGVCRSSDPVRLAYTDANSAFYGVAIAATAGEVVTPAQLASVVGLCRQLFNANHWPTGDVWRVVGHHTEAWPRGRKNDPIGPDPQKPVMGIVPVRLAVAG